MKADFSRNTFDRSRHYSAVRLQQGRVVTDADWNEQADITRYRAERLARDTIGLCGAPLDAAGYRLVATTHALAVHAHAPNEAWILAEDGALLSTTDGGTSWTLIDVTTSAHLRAATRVAETAWLVGDCGVVRKSDDAGSSWNAQDTGAVQTLRAVAATDSQHAWAVGDGGLMVATTDGGVSWTRVATGATRLDAIDFADAANGLAVGPGGVIVATGNGGATWNRVANNNTAHLRALARVDTTRVWCAGDNGTVLRSTDGGITWLQGITTSSATLYAIVFRNALEGWAAGDGGTLLHCTDGGINWQQEDSGSSESLRSLSLVGSEPVWAVGDAAVALRIDAGSPPVAPVTLPATGLSIEAGRYYVNGVLCELESRCSYAHQPDGGAGERLQPGVHLLYLDTWQHHVSALEAPTIREIALGGPDTATRSRTVAQVRALPLPVTSPETWNCDSSIQDWDELIDAARPRLAARAEPQSEAASICEIAATAGYRRLENQLYRVEVHDGGVDPTFKWSRENGSVDYAVVAMTIDPVTSQTTVRVSARGLDSNLDIAVHDRVELIDDERELDQRAGELFEYIGDGDDELELVLDGIPTGGLGQDTRQHPRIRRWDHSPDIAGGDTLAIVPDTWIELEEGVQVRFSANGLYRTGDYWQIPARSIRSNVEWPRDDNGEPVAREPAGITDAYCRLGVVEVDDAGNIVDISDCRELFPPLTALEQMLYVSGDGQDTAPDSLLPQPLILRVARGTVPVRGARVRFEVVDSGGQVGASSGGSPTFDTTTNASGLARCRWILGTGSVAPARHQRVRASLLDADGQVIQGQTLIYTATATLLLQYLGGDGQQANADAILPRPLQLRTVNGGDGVPNVSLTARIVEGGGSVVGPSSVNTDADGHASFGWRIGAAGTQRLVVSLNDADGNELQRFVYGADIAMTTAGDGARDCEVTIGPGGEFERLDSTLLARLLDRNEGRLCLCFLPGTHEVDELRLDGNGESRLSLHGCGQTATLRAEGDIALANMDAIELRDLSIRFAGQSSLRLINDAEVKLSGLSIIRSDDSPRSGLSIINASRRVSVNYCTVAIRAPAPTVFENIDGDCHVMGCRFFGPVSFYGDPDEDPSQRLVEALSGSPDMRLDVGRSQLHFVDNRVQRLTIGNSLSERLFGGEVEGLFRNAVLQGNTFDTLGNAFASGLLVFSGNSFLGEPEDGITPYGAMVANRATAAGNVAAFFDDAAILHFLVPADGGFSGAANQVFTLPS